MEITTESAFIPSLAHYLILSILLFSGGFVLIISTNNLIKTIFGFMILFNAIVLNFACANAYLTEANSLSSSFEPVKSTLVSTFAPLQNIIFNFNNPIGDLNAFYILIIGLVEFVMGAVIAFYTYTKFKTTETDAFIELRTDENKKDGEF